MQAQDIDCARFCCVSQVFFKCFLNLSQRERAVGILPNSKDGHDFDFVADSIAPEFLM